MATEIHLGEGIIIFFAALTLLVTIGITLVAVHLSTDFAALRQGIARLEERLDESNKTEERFKLESEMILRVANNFYRTSTALRVFYLRKLEIQTIEPDSADQTRILVEELKKRNQEIVETIDFFRVLIDSSEENIEGLIDRRPSRETALFLKRLVDVVPTPQKHTILLKFEALTARVLGFSASRWTGR